MTMKRMNKEIEFQQALQKAKETGEPVITAVQAKKEIKLTDYQEDIIKSLEMMKSCDIVIAIKKDRTPGPHVVHMEYNGDGFIRSLFKK
jgi:hypothetical protein